MILWLVLKLEIIELLYLEGFWFVLEDFSKIIFLHGEIFEFCIILLLFAFRSFLM